MISVERILLTLGYYFKANTKYRIQSPLVFDIYTEILNNKKEYACFEDIESIRYALLKSEVNINVEDFGAGSHKMNFDKTRKVSDIAASSLSPTYKCKMLFYTVLFFKPKAIIELGTSLGISTLYLAKAYSSIPVHTIEASPEIQHIAKVNFELAKSSNIQSHLGRFDDILPALLSDATELIYIDGNHTKEATLRYYDWIKSSKKEKMVVIFDDIYWSKGMHEAWKEIEKDAPLTIDYYHFGFVIFSPEIIKNQNFSIIPFHFKPWQIGLFQ